MQGAEGDECVSAADVFGFLAATLADMADRIMRLEAHAGEMIATAPRRSEFLVVLQDFDLVRQMLEDCARLCFAAASPSGGESEALTSAMRLEALRNRFLEQVTEDRPPPKAGDGTGSEGLVDLF